MILTPHEKIIDLEKFLESHREVIKLNTKASIPYKKRYDRVKNSAGYSSLVQK